MPDLYNTLLAHSLSSRQAAVERQQAQQEQEWQRSLEGLRSLVEMDVAQRTAREKEERTRKEGREAEERKAGREAGAAELKAGREALAARLAAEERQTLQWGSMTSEEVEGYRTRELQVRDRPGTTPKSLERLADEKAIDTAIAMMRATSRPSEKRELFNHVKQLRAAFRRKFGTDYGPAVEELGTPAAPGGSEEETWLQQTLEGM